MQLPSWIHKLEGIPNRISKSSVTENIKKYVKERAKNVEGARNMNSMMFCSKS